MRRAIIFLITILVSNLAGMYFSAYLTWWFDMIHHFLGGFFVAMLITSYLVDISVKSKLKYWLIIVGAVSFIGIIWEFAEYLANQTLIDPLYKYFEFKAYFIGDLDDTINDLLMDILGAFTFLSIFRRTPNKF